MIQCIDLRGATPEEHETVFAIAARTTKFALATCPKCRTVQRINPALGWTVWCCGRQSSVQRIRGRYKADVRCDARCEGARGTTCDCSCGGKNHGAAHGAV